MAWEVWCELNDIFLGGVVISTHHVIGSVILYAVHIDSVSTVFLLSVTDVPSL